MQNVPARRGGVPWCRTFLPVGVACLGANLSCPFWPARADSNRGPSESESDALSICATGRYSIKFSRVGYRAVSLRQLMRFSLNGNRYPRKRHIPELRSRNAESDALSICATGRYSIKFSRVCRSGFNFCDN